MVLYDVFFLRSSSIFLVRSWNIKMNDEGKKKKREKEKKGERKKEGGKGSNGSDYVKIHRQYDEKWWAVIHSIHVFEPFDEKGIF